MGISKGVDEHAHFEELENEWFCLVPIGGAATVQQGPAPVG